MSSEGAAMVEPAQPAANNQAQGNNQPQQRTWGATLRAMLFQILIFYAISSFFRSSRPNSGGEVTAPAKNLFQRGQKMVINIVVMVTVMLLSCIRNFTCSYQKMRI